MKTKYFTVNEISPEDGDFYHIGTLAVNKPEELESALITALVYHYDSDCSLVNFDANLIFESTYRNVVKIVSDYLGCEIDIIKTNIYTL